MKNLPATPAVRTLVLLGGGHSHLAVLMQLARHPVPGLELILITRDVETPYSGALPAFITGSCSRDDLLIDLRPLAQMAGARLIRATVERMDLDNRTLHCPGRPEIGFDYLSINIGSRPDVAAIAGAREFAVPVKPIPEFLQHWERMQQEAANALLERRPYTIAIIGGGPASVEMACAMQARLLRNAGLPLPEEKGQESFIRMAVLTSNDALLAGSSPGAQTRTLHALQSRGMDVHLGSRVVSIGQNSVLWEAVSTSASGSSSTGTLHAESILVATGACAPEWLRHTGLALDENGFILVNNALQSMSHPNVFAAGDIATIKGCERPRSGVYAVRQGMPLARNLRRIANGKPLQDYNPQRHALALLNLGDGTAIAARGRWSTQGRWVATLKEWIDKRFVHKYSRIPAPKERIAAPTIRCAGCGAKVSSDMLHDVLSQLHPCTHADVLSAHLSTEDTAMIRIDERRTLLQTVDHFRAFINDPYLFARVATVHCLSDIHAMGATAHSALAVVSVPYAAPRIMQATLRDVMSGCTEVLNAHNTALIGGHSSEAQELSFGLSVNGFVDPDRVLGKRGMQPGDILILCKPLGTGALFAADMRYQAKQEWIENALTHMQHSNQLAAHCFVRHGATSCTDITGFGLLGHLGEMLIPDAGRVVLDMNALPVLAGALDCIANGYVSSLQEDNVRHASLLTNSQQFSARPLYQILFDPQTAGGLLASVPAQQAAACLADLHAAGYHRAACIGEVLATGSEAAAVALRE